MITPSGRENHVWVVEFKPVSGDKTTSEALEQLQAKDYAAKYRAPNLEVIEFSKDLCPIVGW